MARFNLRDIIQAMSIENTAPGTYITGDDGDQFRLFPSDPQAPVFPGRDMVEDNAVGDGRAYKKQGKPYYFRPMNLPYSMALNTTAGVRLLRNWLGGTISTVVNTTPATTDHTIEMKDPGSAPLCMNVIRKLGGEQFLSGDVFVQTIEISQSGASEPRISAQLQNSGHNKKLSATSIDVTDIDTLDTYKKFHGAKTKLTFSDGVGSYDFAADGRLIDVSFSGNQNVVVDQLPGDTPQDASNECHGFVADNFFIDIQDAQMRVKVFMDASFAEFDSWLPNRKLTSVTLTFSTCEIVGATTHHFEYEIKFPVAEFNLDPDQQGNFSAFSFNITAIEGDPTTGSLVIGRIRRATTDGALDETAP